MSKKSNPQLRKEWERRILVYRSSGQTQANWCKANDISIHQFKYWLKRIEGLESKTKPSSQWVPIELEDSTDENSETLQVKVGLASIEVKPGFNPSLLADVITVLKTLC
ncbi:IS66 family insertion sequence element accessory protein TnpA [Neobacillus niacini]|uniref:IS66 family insertion sequence element accessory protein TnpA n=1 Tax=Neobacillus niacini TaxID=86668 RepID=UPI00285AD0EB|nr:IS66 family insertion sequence element accessory protein TnpB [Neobacillus niacini]MDR6999666.1 hypothetical protein [Neobacillus niacini]